MKIELTKSEEHDGTWYRVLIDGTTEKVTTSKNQAEETYNKIVALRKNINKPEVLKSIEL